MDEDIIGRKDELAALATVLDDVASGPRGVLLEGEAGIGKTTLWNWGVRAARERAFRVLTASPSASETTLSYVGLWDLFTGLSDETFFSLPGVQRRALDAALLRSDEEGEPPDQRTVAVAVLGVLRSLATSAPVVVAIDDAQWLDVSSERVLGFAARRLGNAPVSFLCSFTPAEGADRSPELAMALPEDRVVRLEIGPLSPRALSAVIRIHLRESFSGSTVAAIHRACGGNAFHAVELARELKTRSAPLRPQEPLPLPAKIRSLLRARLEQLPRPARDAIFVASALAHPTPAVVEDVLRQAAGPALATAEKAGTLKVDGERIRFSHPLLGSTAYLEADPKKRQQLHLRLAEVLPDPEERARHRAIATPPPNAEVAAALEAAAQAALSRGAPDSAGQLLEQAAQYTPLEQADEARRRDTTAAQHHIAAGDLERAQAILQTWVEKTPAGPARAHVLGLQGQLAFFRDSFPEAAALLQRAVQEAEPVPGLQVSLQLFLGFVLAQMGELVSSVSLASSALERAEMIEDPALIAQTLAGSSVTRFVVGHPVSMEGIRRAVALEDSLHAPLFVSPTFMRALIDMWAGRLEDARDAFARYYNLVVERGDESSVPLVAGLWGGAVQAECWAGDFEKASFYAQAALDAAQHVGSEVARGLALSAQSWVYGYRGEPEATRKASEESSGLLQRAGVSALCLWPLGTLGFLELSRGDAAAALKTLAPIADIVPRVGVGEPSTTPFIPDAIEACVGVGEVEKADELMQWLQDCAARHRRPWTLAMAARCRALILAAKGDLDQAGAALEEAMRHHQQLPMPIERARTLLTKGIIHRRRKEKRAAKDALDEALRAFEDHRLPLWTERARGELGRIGLRPSTGLALTPTEEHVAELAASGRTTQQIAQQLFISPKTVESVIGRIYRKLGVKSRAELATARARKSRV